MREQRLLWSLLALNVVFAASCVTFLSRVKVSEKWSAEAATNSVVEATGIAGASRPRPTCNWANVDSEEYAAYLGKLRAAGCPEEHIQRVVLLDIEERLTHKRLEEATTFDFRWWREDPLEIPLPYLQERARAMLQERQELIEKYFGRAFYESMPESTPLSSEVQLTGAVLGSLPDEIQQKVKAICNASIEQMDATIWSEMKRGEAINAVELTRIREQARAELRQILNAGQMEEFLLRYSRNAQELRGELRALEPTPEEFRRIFRSIDPLAQSMQLKYGDLQSLGSKEQERYLRERESLIRDVLSPSRFQAYRSSKMQPPASQSITAAQP